MTPETLTIDRTFKGVGRIKRRTGTLTPAVRAKLNRMLTALHQDGRLDVLRAIRDGDLALLEALDAYTRRSLDSLPVGATARNLASAITAWRDSLRVPDDYSADHVRTMGTTVAHLRATRAKATVADLPDVLEKLRTTLGARAPRSFNLTRAHCLAFVRATLKRSHPLWLAVAAVEPRKVTPVKRGAPLTPDQMRNLFPDPATDTTDAVAWSMAATGMHAKELWGMWELRADRIHVGGTKRAGRRRDVPLVLAPTHPTMHRRTWEDALRKRTRGITPYDLRRTYANWLESAGIPRTRRKLYLGHGSGDVTDLYERHEVAAFLADDAAKLRAWLALPDAPARLKVAK